MSADPIHTCIERWHLHLRGQLDGGLDAILHEDCTFVSPIVFAPQHGRDLTKRYLTAAGGTLGGDQPDPSDDAATADGDDAPTGGSFRYVRQILDGHDAMLEFETTIDGTWVNGVDIITCDDDAMITDFKVMIRPLRAINLVHEQMREMLERLEA